MSTTAWLDRAGDWFAPEPNTGCWLWLKRTGTNGYGWFGKSGFPRAAHRAAYEAFRGTIAAGMTIDHLCRQKSCVNPDHMQVVTSRENTMRCVYAPATINSRKTHCPRGHEYSPANTDLRNGRRHCRTCHRIHQRMYVARKRGQ